MTEPPVLEVNLADLGPRTRIGTGGQGTVYALVEDPRLVYKEYATRFVDDVDVTTLHRFVRLGSGDGADAAALLGLAAWPTAVVRKDGVVRGFLMPRVPPEFTVELRWPSGPSSVLAQVQYLLNDERYLRARGLHVDDRLRLEFLRDTASALATLHRLGVRVGDLSPNNLLFSPVVRPRCYFLDCDGMRLGDDTVLEQAETPEWHLPADAEELGTEASDAYKFGLLAVRLFAGDQQVRDPAVARKRMDGAVHRLAVRSLDADPGRRPGLAQWLEPLEKVITKTPSVPPPIREAAPEPEPVLVGEVLPPRATVPGPQPVRTGPGRQFWSWFIGISTIVSVLVGLIGTDNQQSPIPLPTYAYDRLFPTADRYPGYLYPSGYPYPTGFLPTGLAPTLPYSTYLRLCVQFRLTVGSGINRQSARVKKAEDAVESLACIMNSEYTDKSASIDRLSRKGPFMSGRIIGVRTAKPQINVIFTPYDFTSAGCWRSRLTLTGDEITAASKPESYSCP
ncbi:hypothetical protein [Actinoplanes sp. NPDC051851]|uniref:hypothetical protein n=1 Tax=Actinoplanes sp. NPDC051851 TaxID=3154753 RepID=UPI00341C9B26